MLLVLASVLLVLSLFTSPTEGEVVFKLFCIFPGATKSFVVGGVVLVVAVLQVVVHVLVVFMLLLLEFGEFSRK